MERMLDALSAAGVRFQHRGDHIQAECPAHPDSSPSLSIDYVGADARVQVHCHASCDAMEVLAALGLEYPMLFDDYEPPEVFKERRAQERREGRAGERRRKPRPKAPEAKRPALPKGRLPKG